LSERTNHINDLCAEQLLRLSKMSPTSKSKMVYTSLGPLFV
jgi:hypothetical protein